MKFSKILEKKQSRPSAANNTLGNFINRPWYFSVASISTVVIICAYESISKGWMSFFLIPASLILLPCYIIIKIFARRVRYLPFWQVRISSLLLTLSMIFLYVGMVGISDSNDVYLFGFYITNSTNPLVTFSNILALAGVCLIMPAFVWLLINLIIFDKRS